MTVRIHGILPVDGPYGDFSDDAGFRAQAHRPAALGMVGKWAIHVNGAQRGVLARACATATPAAEPRDRRSSST